MTKPAFQERVHPWMMACFGPEISADKLERGDRFIEEAIELAQTVPGFTADRAHALVDYVFSRDTGDPDQEVGGVMVTLAAYCLAHDIDMHEAGETELARVWTMIDKIRAKQAAKPKGSALPQVWSDGRPCTTEAFLGAVLEHGGTVDEIGALSYWHQGLWSGALSFLPEGVRERLKGGAS